ncbi:hypothetical protein PV326_000559, partial [Microctonus aethiopoides]
EKCFSTEFFLGCAGTLQMDGDEMKKLQQDVLKLRSYIVSTKDKCSGGSRKTMMAATSDERTVMESTRANSEQNQVVDRLKMLYPMVNEEETPLPRSWSPKDKYNYIGLSQNNLRVHYKGVHKLLI